MSHNPYTPPTSEVQDVAAGSEADAGGNRDVVRACVLIWCACGLSLANSILVFTRLFAGLSSTLYIIMLVSAAIGLGVVLGIAWWMTTKLRAGHNWMRILVVAITVIFLVFRLLYWQSHFTQLMQLYGTDKLLLLTAAVQLAVWLFAVGLLFTARSRNWFERMKRANY